MSTIDTRIVEMRLNNTQFLSGVKQTMAALASLEKAVQMAGATKGLSDLSAAASKVDLSNIAKQATSANAEISDISTKPITDVTGAANTVNMTNISNQASAAGAEISDISTKPITDVTGAANAVDMSNVSRQADTANSKLSGISTRALSLITAAADRVSLGSITNQANKAGASLDNISTRGLTEITAAASHVDLSGISRQAEQVTVKISAMTAAAAASIAGLASKVAQSGTEMAKSFTIAPITDGLKEYETGLNSVQTILANTQAAGTTVKDVNATLKQLNTYADETIYNFSEMTRNIGTFTAAGVDLKTSASAIKGIANLAALSGSSSQQASTAMYQLSQAIAAGKVSLEDWNSVNTAGMGGTVFQRALTETAVKMGKLPESAVKLSGAMKNVTVDGKNFRESIMSKPGKESWLTSDVLTKTLAHFTGDMTDAQLKAEGFSASQIKSIQAQALTAKNSAVEVKTFSQLMDTLKEETGSGWADSWQIIVGDFEGAKKLWTGVHKVMSAAVGKSAQSRNQMLQQWKDMGGRDAFFAGIKNSFEAVMSVVKPIKDAFREIFPATTGKQLAEMSKTFKEFTSHLKLGSETANNLKRTFAGVFAIFGIGWEVLKQVVKTFFSLFKGAGEGSGSFLKVTASVGDFLVALHKAVQNGEGFKRFFVVIGKILQAPIQLIGKLAHAIGSLFAKKPSTSGLDGVTKSLSPLEKLGHTVSNAWDSVTKTFSNLVAKLQPVGAAIKSAFSSIGDTFKGDGGGIDTTKVFGILGAILTGGLILKIKKFISSLTETAKSIGDILEDITSPFGALTETMESMQKTLKAATLMEIAIAIGILAASVVALSKVDGDALTRALVAMGVTFTELMASMAIFQHIEIGKGMGQLILLAAALRLLVSSVEALAKLDWKELAKGLTSTGVLLAMLVGTAYLMPDGKKMMSSATGLLIMAAAIRVLVGAVKDLSNMDWEDLAKGLLGVGGLLASLALFTRFSKADKGGILQGAGIVLLAAGIKILASAVKDFGDMEWDEIGKGLTGIAGGLAIFAAALKLIPPSSVLSAAGVLIVASSLGMLADAVKKMGDMDWENIGKGLTTLGGALLLVAGGLRLIPPSSILSAASILVVASSLGMIADALTKMGGQSWNEVAKGLAAMAGSLVSISVALSLLPPSTLLSAVSILIVASSLGMVADALTKMSAMSWSGVGKSLVSLAGGLTAVSIALALLPPTSLLSAAAIFVAASALGMLADALIKMSSMSWEGIAKGLVALAGSLGIIALAMMGMTGAIPGAIALGIVTAALSVLAPVIVLLGGLSWETIAKGLAAIAGSLLAFAIGGAALNFAIPGLLALGAFIVLIGASVGMAGAGLMAMGSGLALIGTAGVGAVAVLMAAVTGLISMIPNLAKAFGEAILAFIQIIATNAPAIVQAFVTIVSNILTGIQTLVPQLASTFTTILQSILAVINANAPSIVNTFVNVAVHFLEGVRRLIPSILATFSTILQGVLGVIRNNTPAIMATFTTLLQGILATIRRNTPSIISLFLFMLQQLLNAAVNAVPRIVNAGANIIMGFLRGMANKVPGIAKTAADLIIAFINAIGTQAARIAKSAADTIINFINSIASTIRTRGPELGAAGGNLASAIIEGFVKGIAGGLTKVVGSAVNMAKSAYNAAKEALHINSPSKIFMSLGASTAEGYAKGITGSQDQVKAATDAMRKNFQNARDGELKNIQTLEKRLRTLNKARKKDRYEINKTAKDLAQARAEYAKIGRAQAVFNTFGDETARLNSMAGQIKSLTDRISTANKTLEEATKKRDEYYNSVKEQYSNLPDVAKETKLSDYITDLQKRVVDTKVFTAQLAKLRSLGLNDSMYKELIGKGLDAIPFVTQLLDKGKTGVNEINTLDAALAKASDGLAYTASRGMYQAGVDSANGLIKGLQSQKAALEKQMKNLANSMVSQIKRQLGIKSPSREFMEIGDWTVKGLAEGLSKTDLSDKAARQLGNNATVALRRSLEKTSTYLQDSMDASPTIKPVLDLTNIQDGAGKIQSLMPKTPLSVDGAYSQARLTAAQLRNAGGSDDGTGTQKSEQPITFNQYNSSPKALSEAEIYRQTRSQLSRVRGVMTTRDYSN